MNWCKHRISEPSTWGAMSSVSLAIAFLLITSVGWWRDLVYLAAVFSVVAAVMQEKWRS